MIIRSVGILFISTFSLLVSQPSFSSLCNDSQMLLMAEQSGFSDFLSERFPSLADAPKIEFTTFFIEKVYLDPEFARNPTQYLQNWEKFLQNSGQDSMGDIDDHVLNFLMSLSPERVTRLATATRNSQASVRYPEDWKPLSSKFVSSQTSSAEEGLKSVGEVSSLIVKATGWNATAVEKALSVALSESSVAIGNISKLNVTTLADRFRVEVEYGGRTKTLEISSNGVLTEDVIRRLGLKFNDSEDARYRIKNSIKEANKLEGAVKQIVTADEFSRENHLGLSGETQEMSMGEELGVYTGRNSTKVLIRFNDGTYKAVKLNVESRGGETLE